MIANLQISDNALCFDARKYNELYSVQTPRFWKKVRILNIYTQPKTSFSSACQMCDVQFEDGFVERGIYFTEEFIVPFNN